MFSFKLREILAQALRTEWQGAPEAWCLRVGVRMHIDPNNGHVVPRSGSVGGGRRVKTIGCCVRISSARSDRVELPQNGGSAKPERVNELLAHPLSAEDAAQVKPAVPHGRWRSGPAPVLSRYDKPQPFRRSFARFGLIHPCPWSQPAK